MSLGMHIMIKIFHLLAAVMITLSSGCRSSQHAPLGIYSAQDALNKTRYSLRFENKSGTISETILTENNSSETRQIPFTWNACQSWINVSQIVYSVRPILQTDLKFEMGDNNTFLLLLDDGRTLTFEKIPNHGLESTGAPPAAGTPETHP